MAETPDERAERLLHVGWDVAVRIRDEDPATVAAAVDGLAPHETRDLVILLAACVPVDQPAAQLLAWFGPGIRPTPSTETAERRCLKCAARERPRGRYDVDQVKVTQAIDGQRTAADLTTGERRVVVSALVERGKSDAEIAMLLRWSGGRRPADAVLGFRRYHKIPAIRSRKAAA
jgi:hypothetical protein